ncbi:MAG: AMP-binding protein [Burkholderiaceae bacterium]
MNEQTAAVVASGHIPSRIAKTAGGFRVRPNLVDYAAVQAAFSWERARESLAGLPGGGLNIAYEAVDHHLGTAHADRTAIRWIGKAGARRELSYRDLAHATNRFANALHGLGTQPGDRVCVLMGRLPEFHVAVLGALKAGCVAAPLARESVTEQGALCCALAEAHVLVTTSELYQTRVAGLRHRLPKLKHVIVVGAGFAEGAGVRRWGDVVEGASHRFTTAATDTETVALLHFTRTAEGRTQTTIHVHGAVLAHAVTGHYALDFHDDDIFWCTADPGCVTGTSYGIIAALVAGVTNVVVEAEFDPATCCALLEQERVSVWYTAAPEIRDLMDTDAVAVRSHDLSALRFMASVGEPLTADAVIWGIEVFGLPFHDNWWQTESGAIMIANYAAMDIKPGSMGKPLPGIRAAIVRRDAQGRVETITRPDVEGELALEAPWPSMMRGYLHDEERYRNRFCDGWYLSGDMARCDADGYYWFVRHAGDAIDLASNTIA